MKFDSTKSIWQEKYRPQCIEDMILPDDIKAKFKSYIKNGIPNLGLWSSNPGLGKSSLANAIIKELDCPAMFINASLEKGIDVLRDTIQKFAVSSTFDSDYKVVVMDECLEENEEVVFLKDGHEVYIKLKELIKGMTYDCISLNLETNTFEKDTCQVVSDKIDDIYEVELEDGRTIKVTSNHPFIIEENGKLISKSIDDGLTIGDDVKCQDHFNKIKSIKKLGASRVINLTVHKNHTFVTKNGIVTHNCDNFSRDGQSAFRAFLDEYSENCRFIFTGNYKEKIIEPLLDRLENYDFASFKKEQMIRPIIIRLADILKLEHIEFDKQDLKPIFDTYYPGIRSMIQALQKFSSTGKLIIDKSTLNDASIFDDVIKLAKMNTYFDMIQEVNKINSPDAMYSYLYNNTSKYFKNESIPQTVITIAKYQDMSSNVRDKNLNLAACLTELMDFVK